MPLRRTVCLFLIAGAVLFAALPSASAAPVTSKCLAVAQNLSPSFRVAYRKVATTFQLQARTGSIGTKKQRTASLQNKKTAALANNEVRVTYAGHSTFIIESPKGIRIATDYAGYHGGGPVPDVVTMNHAHPSHYTDAPDPKITHVLRGWNPDGGYAEHNLTVEDVYIRNVPTNIRSWVGGTEKFGNSVFIFEVSGLCIGHLGHLHHELTLQQLGQIGQLDVVMAAIDGTFTLDYDGMTNVLKELRARIVIPMHFFGSLDGFQERLRDTHDIEISKEPTVVLSPATMPKRPKFLVLPGY